MWRKGPLHTNRFGHFLKRGCGRPRSPVGKHLRRLDGSVIFTVRYLPSFSPGLHVPATSLPLFLRFRSRQSLLCRNRVTKGGRKGHSDLATTETKAAAKESPLSGHPSFSDIKVGASLSGSMSGSIYSSFSAPLASCSVQGPESRGMPLVDSDLPPGWGGRDR